MSTETVQLIAAYEALPPTEKQEFVKALFDRLPPIDSGLLGDEDVALAGDRLAATLDQEENGPATWCGLVVRLWDGGEGPARPGSQCPILR